MFILDCGLTMINKSEHNKTQQNRSFPSIILFSADIDIAFIYFYFFQKNSRTDIDFIQQFCKQEGNLFYVKKKIQKPKCFVCHQATHKLWSDRDCIL